MPGRPLYLFIHLFKTGGTTINGHLAKHLEWDTEFVHLGPWGDRVRARDGVPPPAEWPEERWSRARVVAGHGVDAATHLLVPGTDPRYFTILRDPAALAVSRHNFEVARTGEQTEFWEWYRDKPRDFTLKRLRRLLGAGSAKEVRRRIGEFWFVGVTEHLDEDLPHLFGAIGVPTVWEDRRVTGAGDDLEDLDLGRETFAIERRTVLTDEMRLRIHAENPKDLRLYRFAVEQRKRRRAALGWGDGPDGPASQSG